MSKITEDAIPYLVFGFITLMVIWLVMGPQGKELLETGMRLLVVVLVISLAINLLVRVFVAAHKGDRQ